jgi:hypothetical protein
MVGQRVLGKTSDVGKANHNRRDANLSPVEGEVLLTCFGSRASERGRKGPAPGPILLFLDSTE